MKTESEYHGRTVAMYVAEKQVRVEDFKFKGHALQILPPCHLPFTEVIEITDDKKDVVCLGREPDDTYWTVLVEDPMTKDICVNGQAPTFDVDIVP